MTLALQIRSSPLGVFGPQLQPQRGPEGAEARSPPPAGVATAESGGSSLPAGAGTPRAALLGPSQSRIDQLDKLPSAYNFLDLTMRVDVSARLRLLAGESILIVAFMLKNNLCFNPWTMTSVRNSMWSIMSLSVII